MVLFLNVSVYLFATSGIFFIVCVIFSTLRKTSCFFQCYTDTGKSTILYCSSVDDAE